MTSRDANVLRSFSIIDERKTLVTGISRCCAFREATALSNFASTTLALNLAGDRCRLWAGSDFLIVVGLDLYP
jgi:hypothetical protein